MAFLPVNVSFMMLLTFQFYIIGIYFIPTVVRMCFCIITVILLSCVIFPFIFAHLSTVFSSMIHVTFAISILHH